MSFSYFSTLNYTLANEDTAMEIAMLPDNVNHVATVAGSGGRAIPLLSRSPKKLTCIDLSQEQLYLTELRVEALRALTHSEFLAFFGYPPEPGPPARRKELFAKIKLSEPAGEFFGKLFEASGWHSLLYAGRWEQTFAKISKICKFTLGEEALRIFEPKDFNQHLLYIARDFPRFRWNLLIQGMGNSSFFNAILYKGHFPKKNIEQSYQTFYRDAFTRLFAQGPARQNFFLQLALLGQISFHEGNPIECDPATFEKMKTGLAQCDVKYVQGNLVQVVSQLKDDPVDFLSFSDVPSYFSSGLEKSYMQQVLHGIAPRGQVVIRYYLHVGRDVDTSQYTLVTNEYQQAIEAEKTQMYIVEVYKKKL